MAQIGEKNLEVPIKDYDNDDYSSVVEEVVKPGVDLVNIEAKDLLVYFCERFKQTHGYDYKVDWVKELAILKSYIERYGQDAGPMLAILFDEYKGLMNSKVMTISAFTKGSKWIQDILYIQLQSTRSKEEETKVDTEGLMNSNDFLRRLSLGK